MPLSNAERQSRYRQRLRDLAARGVMSPVQAELLAEARLSVRRSRPWLAEFAEGRVYMTVNGVDRSREHASSVESQIRTNERLLQQYDPEGLTRDGNIELGDVRLSDFGGAAPGAWVTFALDQHGQAVAIRAWQTEAHAEADAGRSGRHLGILADDWWSIAPARGAPGK